MWNFVSHTAYWGSKRKTIFLSTPIAHDGAVLKVLENLISFVDEVNDRPVGNPKRRFDEYSSKFSLSYETKVINPVGKRQMTEGDAR
jgi:hypothetical protein